MSLDSTKDAVPLMIKGSFTRHEMEIARGKIIFFNKKSRFGFIKNYSDNKNYYVHEKNLLESVEPEDEVEFELSEAKRGTEAIKVKKSG